MTASEMPTTIGTGATSVRGIRLARRLFGNYLFLLMNLGFRVLEQFLLIPLFLYAWGTELYKDWLIVSAIAFLLNSLTFGTDEYFGNTLLRYVSAGNVRDARRQAAIGLFVGCLISLAVMTLVYTVLFTTNIASALGLSAMGERTVALVLLIMTLPLWISYPSEILRGAYRAFGDFSRGECILAIFFGAQLAAMVAALSLKQPPVVIAACFSSTWLLCPIVMTVDVYRRYPAMRVRIAAPTRAEWRTLVPQSLLYFTNPLASSLAQYGTLMLFGLFSLSAPAIVAFNTFRVFTGLTRQMGPNSFAVGSGIEMARQYCENDHAACRNLYSHTGRIVSCLVGVLGGLSIPLSAPFIKLWTHGAVTGDTALVSCFLAGIFLSAPGRASLMLLRYTNHAYAIAIAYCTYAIGGLLLSFGLVYPLGIIGVALAFAVAETLSIGIYPALTVGTVFHFSASGHLLKSYAAGAGAFAMSYVVAYVLFKGDVLDIPSLIVRIAVWACFALPVSASFVLSRDQRARLIWTLRGAVARKRPG